MTAANTESLTALLAQHPEPGPHRKFALLGLLSRMGVDADRTLSCAQLEEIYKAQVTR